MKRFSRSITLKLVASLAFSSLCWIGAMPASAAGSASSNLSLSASVSANCTISTAPISFGAYDPVSANASSALNATGTVTVTCTNGSTGVISLGQGSNAAADSTNSSPSRQLSDGASHSLAYSLYQDSSRMTVWGNTTETGVTHHGDGTATGITVYGSVPGGQNMPAGSYSDTVVATVTF